MNQPANNLALDDRKEKLQLAAGFASWLRAKNYSVSTGENYPSVVARCRACGDHLSQGDGGEVDDLCAECAEGKSEP